jgi:hypothetical protein
MTIKRAYSVDQILSKKFIDIKFEDEWLATFGEPEASGVWLIWGQSGSGKSRFCMQLAKELTKYGKVAYNSLEEGARKTMQKNIRECRMHEVKKKFIVLNREPIEHLKIRLKKKQAPRFVFIDSFQYTGLTRNQYIKLKEEFPDVLFIFISHAEGKEPQGNTAKFVRYDSDIKIRIEGYKAFPTSRYGGGEPYIIWKEGARDYWAGITAT